MNVNGDKLLEHFNIICLLVIISKPQRILIFGPLNDTNKLVLQLLQITWRGGRFKYSFQDGKLLRFCSPICQCSRLSFTLKAYIPENVMLQFTLSFKFHIAFTKVCYSVPNIHESCDPFLIR